LILFAKELEHSICSRYNGNRNESALSDKVTKITETGGRREGLQPSPPCTCGVGHIHNSVYCYTTLLLYDGKLVHASETCCKYLAVLH